MGEADLPGVRYLVVHPAGPILVDTGVGVGNAFIDDLYTPVHHDLVDALSSHGVSVDDVRTVITSHLHFDHCGQNDKFAGSTILVQQAEADAARAPLYTVPEWAFPPDIELTLIEGDHAVAAGVRIIATPGHTPGHQSVLVDADDGTRTILCCQATWNASSFDAARLGDDGWDQAAGTASLERLHTLKPDRVLISHDADEWRRDRPTPGR